MCRQHPQRTPHGDPLSSQELDPRLPPLPTACDPEKVAHHLELTHAAEDDDVEESIGWIGVRHQGKAEPMVWTDTDRDRRRPPPDRPAVDLDQHPRSPST